MAHTTFDRRGFLKITAVGSGVTFLPKIVRAETGPSGAVEGRAAIPEEIRALIDTVDRTDPYFTPAVKHATTSALKVKPGSMTPDQLKAAGLHQDSWSMEITQNGDFLGKPRTIAAGNAVSFADLAILAGKKPVKMLKCLTDPLGGTPLGHGLWEGVALRDVLALAKPKDGSNFRRIECVAPLPGDPGKEAARAGFAASRVYEDPEGLPPVLVALKYNGDAIPTSLGGPVRIIVPESYENKSVSHLRRLIVSGEFLIGDSAAGEGIDPESPVKTCAMQVYHPSQDARLSHDEPMALIGLAQVGPCGLRGVQVAWVPAETRPDAGDPYLEKLPWKDAWILPCPAGFGSGLPGGLVGAFGMDSAGARPVIWPMPFFVCRFGAVVRDLAPGKYLAYTRSIDAHGDAQPLPRPFDRSGVVDQIYRPVPFELT
jgi:DMSO/TMAO reductase YedYZ molybdopterin-dependent catalytic subunit